MPETLVLRINPGARVATPLCRLAQELASYKGWRRYGGALLLGVVYACAMPPVDLSPLVFVVFPALLWLDNGSANAWASARLGYVFGMGFFVAGLYWMTAALFVDIGQFWWAVPFALLGLPAYLSVYCAAALGVTAFVANRFRLCAASRVVLFAVAWAASEWARGHFLTGLPWNLSGYAWSGGFPGSLAVLQTTAVAGIYGLSLITVLAAALLALLGTASLEPIALWRRIAPVAASMAIVGLMLLAGGARLALCPPVQTGTWLRLVQPSIPQSLKLTAAAAEDNFQQLIRLSDQPAQHPLAAILWPEAAASYLDYEAAHRQAIARVAPAGGYVITGTIRAVLTSSGRPAKIWNSIQAIDPRGEIVASYDKTHLVPFGEYIPFAEYLPVKPVAGEAIGLSTGQGAQTKALPGLPPFAPIICYEAIFPGTAVAAHARPAWILNVTNDAWYGRSSGPYQHFAIARMRAIEEGLPLVRAANNGISGVVDPFGRVLGRTDLDSVSFNDIALPMPAGMTLYARVGDWVFAAMLLLCLLSLVGWQRWDNAASAT